MLQLTFLGTSAGVPTKHRNVTALAIESISRVSRRSSVSSGFARPWLLIDCGEGTQHQLLHTKLSLQQLAVICITHVHGDHCYGLAGLLASMSMAGRQAPLVLIAPQPIAKLLDTLTITTELYFDFPIEFVAVESLLSEQQGSYHLTVSTEHQITIDVTQLSHRVPCYAYRITQQLQHYQLDIARLNQANIEPAQGWSTLQRGEDIVLDTGELVLADEYVTSTQSELSVVVAGDNDCPELLDKAVQDTSVLVHEATYTQDVLDKIQSRPTDFDPQHSSVQQVARFAQQAGVDNLILTHFSARYQLFEDLASSTPNMAHVRAEATQNYKGNLWLAQDFAQFHVTHAKVDYIAPNGESFQPKK